MKELISNLAVQSYCFREIKDNREVARAVRAIGLERVEVCGVHADFGDPAEFGKVVEVYGGEGVSIVSIGVQTFVGREEERAWFECAARAGAKHLSAHVQVDSFPRALAKLRGWSREFGIRVGLHCHGGYMFGGSPDELEHLIALGGPEVGLCLDTAWAMQIGPWSGKPVDWVRRFGGSLYGVHVKDFVFGPDGGWRDVIVGEGNLPLGEFLRALEEVKFGGVLVLEYEADANDPVPSLRRCVEAVRRAAG